MGQFSWLDCKDGSQILDNKLADVFLLIPKQFGGGHHHENCYDGYGHFGLCDVYEEVATWNRKYLSSENVSKPIHSDWESNQQGEEFYARALRRYEATCKMLEDFRSGKAESYMIDQYGSNYLRLIGIEIACYDKDNAALRYPIKITHDASAVYEDCKPSLSDPDQGWPADDD